MDISARQAQGVVDFSGKSCQSCDILIHLCSISIYDFVNTFPVFLYQHEYKIKGLFLDQMIAVINFARKWNKTAYYLFSGYYILIL